MPKSGDWVILVNDRVVACDKNVKKIMKIAGEYEGEEYIISKEPSSNHCYY